MDPVGDQATLADDERRLAELAAAFHRELVASVAGWVTRVVEERVDRPLDVGEHGRVAALGLELADALDDPLKRALTADVDAGAGSPLAVLRGAAGPISNLLDDLGVTRPRRDEFSEERFPFDGHDLGPTSFREVDPALHEPGIVWGAARAHVHLRRRRESP